VSGAVVSRGDVYWVNLDPTIGSEIQKTRPALVVSPDDMNTVLPRVIIAPITSAGRSYGLSPGSDFSGEKCAYFVGSDPMRGQDKAGKKDGQD